MKTQFNFEEIIARIPQVLERQESVLKEANAKKLPLPESYYEKYEMEIKKEAPYLTRTKSFKNKAEAYNYLYKEGYEKWYIMEKLNALPYTQTMLTDLDTVKFTISTGITTVEDKFEDILDEEASLYIVNTKKLTGKSNDKFVYYIDNFFNVYRENTDNGYVMKLNNDERMRVKIDGKRYGSEDIWNKFKNEKVK